METRLPEKVQELLDYLQQDRSQIELSLVQSTRLSPDGSRRVFELMHEGPSDVPEDLRYLSVGTVTEFVHLLESLNEFLDGLQLSTQSSTSC